MSGQQPPCPRCEDATAARQERGKRALGVGKLRPDIVLYGEEHPESQQISDIIQHDLSLAPDMLIIMGTSLKVHGLKTVVKEFAKAVHNKKEGKVIFINYTKPADSVWADTIDFWVQMDCDAWVHDLKEKKPLIWLPPGSVADEPQLNKRRRRANNEIEKTNKKSAKAEPSESTSTSAIALSGKVDKVQKKDASKATKPPEPKPQPKRPAAFRDHKANGAFLTTKIIRDLAAISGRHVPIYQSVLAAKEVPKSEKPSSRAERPFASKQALKKGCGPRLKNARTRKPEPRVAARTTGIAGSNPDEKHIKNEAGQNEAARSGTGKESADRSCVSGPSIISTHTHPPPLNEEPATKLDSNGADATAPMKQEASRPVPSSHQTVLAEMPIPNSGPDPIGGDNSILAAVKSNHRIRKPKAFFEPKTAASKAGRVTSVPSGNTKSRVKSTQGKKAKSLGKAGKIEQGQQAPQKQTPVLPPPRPRLTTSTPSSAIINTAAAQNPGTPAETYTLPPLQFQDFQRYRYPIQYREWPYPPTQPPAYLEPIVVVEGPPSDMSPTTSPQYWRKRDFSMSGPQPRHFEGPCRGLDFMGTSHVAPAAASSDVSSMPPTMAPPPSQVSVQDANTNATLPLTGRAATLADAPFLAPPQATKMDAQPPPGVQSVEDSPTRQLQRENEAAAALSQMKSPPGFDERQFAMI